MQKRIFTLKTVLLLTAMLLGLYNMHAQSATAIVGAGASSSNINGPIYRSSTGSSFRYSKFTYLYPQADMLAAGMGSGAAITSISWYKATAADFTAGKRGTFKIYVIDTANYTAMWSSSTATQTWNSLISAATLVYVDTVGSTLLTASTGWINFPLSTPITYTGGALRVMVSWNYTSSGNSGASLYWADDGANPGTVYGMASNAALLNDTTLQYAGAAPNGSTFSANRPQTEFTFNQPGCSGTPSGFTVQGPAYSLCNGDATFLALGGIQALSGISYLWQSSTSLNGPYTSTGNTSISYNTPALTTGTYYRVLVTCANSGLTDTVTPFLVPVNTAPSITGTSPDSRCGIGSVTLSASGAAPQFVWYDNAIGGSIVGKTSSISPTVSATTTYYVANSSGDTSVYTQSAPNATGTTIVSGDLDSAYLKFNVYHALRLQSVVIYAGAIGTYNVIVTNNSGVSMGMGSVTVNASQISSSTLIPITVSLNAYLPTGNGYYIYLINSGNIGLSWLYTGNGDIVSYPYALSGLLSITTSGYIQNGLGYIDTNNFFGDGKSEYAGFFHFKVVPDCESGRTPVVATVSSPPSINIGVINSGYCSGTSSSAQINVNSTDNHYMYTWAGGSYTNLSNNAVISVSPTVTTTYTVTGTDTSTHCVGTNTQVVNVLAAPLAFNTLVTPSTTCPGVPLTLTTNLYSNVSYCSPSYTTGTTAGAFLDSIILGTLQYHSSSSAAADLVIPASTTTVALNAGGTYTISLKTNAASPVFNAWIDLNGDGNYDNSPNSNEIIVNNLTATKATTSTVSFTLPSYIISGTKHMRIRLDDGYIFQGPCVVGVGGQTIDFYVTVNGNSLSYTWSPSASLNSPTGDSVTSIGVNTTTIFTVTIHDQTSGCNTTQTNTVNITPASATIAADPSAICGSGSTNLYTLALTSGSVINWQSSTTSNGTYTNVGSTANPYTTGTNSSLIYYRAMATCGTSTAYSNVIAINVSAPPGTPAVYNTNTCGAAAVTLRASGAGTGVNYNWFDSATSVNPIYTGANFATPTLTSTRMYYVSAYKDLGTNNTHVGKVGITNGSGGPNYFYNAEIFQTYVPTTLNGVYVYPSYNSGGISGTDSVTWFNIQLWDSNGNVLDTMHVNVTLQMVNNTSNGIATYVPLNFNISNPALYYLARGGKLSNSTFGQSYIGLWRDNSSSLVQYPYNLAGVLSIQNSLVLSATSASYNPNGYYYFYNWSVGYNLRCGGIRAADTVTVNAVPVAGAITPSASTVCSGSSQAFTISGNAGAGLQWQYSTSGSSANNSSWNNFGSVNASNATLNNINSITYVRAVSSSPTCASVSSNSAQVKVDSSEIGITISNVTSTSALISWNSISGATYTITLNGNTFSNGSANTYTATGLTACTSNSITITANGGTCGGIPTGTTNFTLKPANITLSLSAGSGTGINASWTAGVGPYKLYYANLASPQNYTVINVTGTSYKIASTTAGATYTAYVVDQGSSCSTKPQSNMAYINIAGGTCTGAAPVITGVITASNSITVNWSGSAPGYQFFYKPSNGSWTNTPVSANTYTLKGLSPNSCYTFFVYNRCSSTSLGYGSFIDTACSASACATPLNLELSRATCKGFTATWAASSGASSYQVFFSSTNGGTPWVFNYTSIPNSYVANIFSRGSVVSVYVKANCTGGGQSISSNVESITVLSAGCKDGDNTSPSTGNTYNTAGGSMNVYPNPNDGQFIVDAIFSNTTDNAKLQVMNLLGQVMTETIVSNNNGLVHTTVNNANLAAGIYLVRVQIGSETHLARIVIQR